MGNTIKAVIGLTKQGWPKLEFRCIICSTIFQDKHNRPRKTCSNKCQHNLFKNKHFSLRTEFKQGRKAHNFKGKRIMDNGYVWLSFRGGHKGALKGIYEHRYLAKKWFKDSKWLVHHIDGNPLNNNKNNLAVIFTDVVHKLLHKGADVKCTKSKQKQDN